LKIQQPSSPLFRCASVSSRSRVQPRDSVTGLTSKSGPCWTPHRTVEASRLARFFFPSVDSFSCAIFPRSPYRPEFRRCSSSRAVLRPSRGKRLHGCRHTFCHASVRVFLYSACWPPSLPSLCDPVPRESAGSATFSCMCHFICPPLLQLPSQLSCALIQDEAFYCLLSSFGFLLFPWRRPLFPRTPSHCANLNRPALDVLSSSFLQIPASASLLASHTPSPVIVGLIANFPLV